MYKNSSYNLREVKVSLKNDYSSKAIEKKYEIVSKIKNLLWKQRGCHKLSQKRQEESNFNSYYRVWLFHSTIEEWAKDKDVYKTIYVVLKHLKDKTSEYKSTLRCHFFTYQFGRDQKTDKALLMRLWEKRASSCITGRRVNWIVAIKCATIK